jgi:hypothetical protein
MGRWGSPDGYDVLFLKRPMFGLAHFIDGFIEVFVEMKPVQDRLVIRLVNPASARGAIRRPHVHGDTFDPPAAFGAQLFRAELTLFSPTFL